MQKIKNNLIILDNDNREEESMDKLLILGNILVAFCAFAPNVQGFDSDTINTSAGDLRITFIGHGTLMFSFGGKTIHIDPIDQMADYTKLPKADIIMLTHDHFDHMDLKAIAKLETPKTVLIISETCAKQIKGGIVMHDGDINIIDGLKIEAVPAYNIIHMRSPGVPFHPKGIGNGYVISFGDKRVYIAGDTENTPEMKALKAIDIAFLPMNLPYTMTPEMVADAAKAFKPKVLYPYHYGDTDPAKLITLLKNNTEIEVRIRNMK
jgi:L-ascorbate metabolism protein UlaG (beta-lactamase superfamily)